jgi:hypothetical protein
MQLQNCGSSRDVAVSNHLSRPRFFCLLIYPLEVEMLSYWQRLGLLLFLVGMQNFPGNTDLKAVAVWVCLILGAALFLAENKDWSGKNGRNAV